MINICISNLEKYSGIKAHTIRTWEKRYHLFNPKRSASNIRSYDIQELRYFLQLCLLNHAGYRISALAAMTADEMEKHIDLLSQQKDLQTKCMYQLLISMLSMNTQGFEDILDDAVRTWGIDLTIKKIIIPFIERVGIFSCGGSSVEIDFAITALRQKIIFGIEGIDRSSNQNRSALLFLPKGEHYDLLLLYFRYLFQSCGVKTIYMGTNISAGKLKEVTRLKQPDFLFTYTSSRYKKQLDEIRNDIETSLPRSAFFITAFEKNMIDANHPELKFIHHEDVFQLTNQ